MDNFLNRIKTEEKSKDFKQPLLLYYYSCFVYLNTVPTKSLETTVIFRLPTITTPCPIKFKNSYACSNNLI